MKLSEYPPLHLTYCLNVHPGQAWRENVEAIRTATAEVRRRVAPGTPFGLGLRLSRRAADELTAPPAWNAFLSYLAEHGLYVFTINGFPYGEFHAEGVKTSVYRPDWRDPARLEYTCRLLAILARLLPTGVDGSVSTVPGAYRSDVAGPEDRRRMAEHLAAAALCAEQISLRHGRDLHLALEPEPDCYLESTDDVLRRFREDLLPFGQDVLRRRAGLGNEEAESLIRRRIGICFDTCHLAVGFEPLAGSLKRLCKAGIRISKIQISSALEAKDRPAGRERLQSFCDPVYLHQVKSRGSDGRITSEGDLEDALKTPSKGRLWRIHCHVPLYVEGMAPLMTTSIELDDAFFDAVVESGCTHVEMETYTFDVLPADWRREGVVGSIVREYEWLRPRLNDALNRARCVSNARTGERR